MNKVNLAVIGAGNIGTMHIAYLAAEKVQGCELYAVCDNNPAKLEAIREKYGEIYVLYSSVEDVLKDEQVDAVFVATPHYDHPTIAIRALQAGKHVLIEKPAGVYTKKVQEMNEEARKHPELSFGIMYNQRTNPMYQKARELVQSGALGELRRTNWIITTWYRSQSYYDSGGWRASWRGEGGGVLLNQDPHQLDLWQWICGMPKRVIGFASFGKHRAIEVEDEVTAYVEYGNGATGIFMTSVSEVPGTNRFEIVGSKGKLVIEEEKMSFWQSTVDERTFNETYTGGFGEPEIWKIELPVVYDNKDEHQKILQNFIDNILTGKELLAPGYEGINGLSISNAIHLSAWQDRWIELPIDGDLYYEELEKRVATSKLREVEEKVLDTDATY